MPLTEVRIVPKAITQYDAKDSRPVVPVTEFVVRNDTAAKVPLKVYGATAQSGDLLQLLDALGGLLTNFSATGELFAPGATLNALSVNSSLVVAGGTVDMGGAVVTNIADPVLGSDAASKSYVDALTAGIKWKTSVRAATTAAGTLATSFENGDVIDGVTLATGDRILVKNQAAGAENGIRIVAASGAPARASDADSSAELVSAAVFVEEGTVNGDRAFVCTNNAPIVVNTTALTWTAFASVIGALIASNNLSDLTSASTARSNLGLGLLSVKDTISTADIDNDAVTPAKLDNGAALSVFGRSANSSGDRADITFGTDGHVLRRSGTTVGTGTLTAGAFATTPGIVTLAMLDNAAALTVVGNATNGSAARTDISFGTDGHVLRRSGTSVGAGTLAAGAFATGPGIVTLAMLNNGSANSVVGVTGNASAARADIAASTTGHVLRLSGTTLAFGTLAAGAFATGPGIVTLAMLDNASALTVTCRSANSSGARGDVALATNAILQNQSSVLVSTTAPINLDLSNTGNDLGGNSGAKGRKFLIPFEWNGSGSQTPAIGFNIGGRNMDLPQHPMPCAAKLTRLSINIQHNTGSSPGNWQITCSNATAGTTGSINASTTNLANADNVTHGAPDTLITFAAGDRLRIYVNSGGALTDPQVAGFMEFVTNG